VSDAETGAGSAPTRELISASIQSAAIARRRHLRGEWTGPEPKRRLSMK
jgi:hypothetical protein